jgi:hypothetical protein
MVSYWANFSLAIAWPFFEFSAKRGLRSLSTGPRAFGLAEQATAQFRHQIQQASWAKFSYAFGVPCRGDTKNACMLFLASLREAFSSFNCVEDPSMLGTT